MTTPVSMKGMNGLSTRFAFKILSRVFNFDHVEVAANPVHLFYVLEQQIEREQFPQEQAERYLEFPRLTRSRNMPSLSAKRSRRPTLNPIPNMGKTFSTVMLPTRISGSQDQEYRDPDTGQLFDRESLNAELEKIEKPAGISNPKDFRRDR